MSQSELTRNLRQTVSAARLELTPIPGNTGVMLHLISPDYPRGRLPQEEMLRIMQSPAYWAFCWASGQVLAQYLSANPSICRNRSVLDLGAGSGVVGIAAARLGASRVIACDLDPQALDACRINAAVNGVSLELLDDLDKLDEPVDLLIAADVLYDRENLEYLDRLGDFAREVLIADSRIRDEAVFTNFIQLEKIRATTIPDLDELQEYGQVSIYHRHYDQPEHRAEV